MEKEIQHIADKTGVKSVSQNDKVKAVKMMLKAIVEAVDAAGPMGAPAGILYTAFMQYGCNLQQFQQIMGELVQGGALKHSGHCYTVTPLGKKFYQLPY